MYARCDPNGEYIDAKELRDGEILRIVTWVSDVLRPGHRMYQLELWRDRVRTSRIPARFENFDKQQIRAMYQRINSSADFDNLWDKVS